MTKKTEKAEAEQTQDDEEGIVIRARFSDRPDVFKISLSDMSNREQVDIEEFFNRPIEVLLLDGWLLNSRKGLVFLAYLARRRKEESFTFEEAMDNFETQVDDQTVPTEASKDAGSPT